jgi:hypothetical protein
LIVFCLVKSLENDFDFWGSSLLFYLGCDFA